MGKSSGVICFLFLLLAITHAQNGPPSIIQGQNGEVSFAWGCGTFDIDWGDGAKDRSDWHDEVSHIYVYSGVYTMKATCIDGSVSKIISVTTTREKPAIVTPFIGLVGALAGLITAITGFLAVLNRKKTNSANKPS